MAIERPKPACLNAADVKKVQTLEKQLGVVLVAYEPPLRVAKLSPAKVKQLKEAEQKIGVVLVAYE